MLLDSSQWLLLIGGIICTGVGALVLFSDSFLHLLDRTLWKRTKVDHALFTTDSAYVFNRYGRGLGALVLGVGLLWRAQPRQASSWLATPRGSCVTSGPPHQPSTRPPRRSAGVSRSYIPHIDWLKALGMVLILYGHFAGWAPLATLPPIYTKQLGVAFFLFASGYSLSLESRDRRRVVFNRLFEVFLFGIAVALIISVASVAAGGRPNLSNYEPFVGGVNVVFDNFPANPTSWYLGTYIHIIVLWALFSRRLQVSKAVLLLSLTGEIAVRALLMQTAGRFVAYMLVPNWMTVFLLGYFYGQREGRLIPPDPATRERWSAFNTAALGALIISVTGWSLLASHLPFDQTFPFMRLRVDSPAVGELLVASMVSLIYVAATWLVFVIVKPIPSPAAVRFVARNSLIIFLAHMPVYYAIAPFVNAHVRSPSLRSAIFLTVGLPGLGLLSECVRRIVRPGQLRERLYHSFSEYRSSSTA
jgi:peptidoglycan/LPS O-acetylase OafA/YrhL